MKVMVLGSTGQTGYHVVKQLIENDIQVIAIARNSNKFKDIQNDQNLEIIIESILDIQANQLKDILLDVDIIISCLGHNISLKGIFGRPHYLVTEAVQKTIVNANKTKLKKFILMNTTACLNNSIEKLSLGENIIINIMKALLPPQKDNEKALKYLEINHTKESNVQWIAVRPDTLTTENQITDYSVFESVQRSPIFNAGKTSRINAANFITELVSNEELWDTWKYKMPVIYNA
jgi:putative NADH-flavin reductase